MLAIAPGMKNGPTRSGPRSASVSLVFSISGKPPIPVPIITADAIAVGLVDLEAGVLERHRGGRHRVVDEAVEALHLFLFEVEPGIEVAHLAGDLGRELGHVDQRDRADAAPALEDAFPGRAGAHAERRYQADAGHRHPTAGRVRGVGRGQDAPVDPWCASM